MKRDRPPKTFPKTGERSALRRSESLVGLGVILVAMVLSCAARPRVTFALSDGDRVVFYGDDITEVQFYDNAAEPRLYTTFVETYAVTRFPNLHLLFVNSAWAGDRVTGGAGGPIDVRLERDVFAHRPTVMTIMLGMNDGGKVAYDSGLFHTFTLGYQHILDAVRSALPGIRITALQPSSYDEVTAPPVGEAGGYNGVLLRYGAWVKELGQREGLMVADLNAPLVDVLEKANALDPATAKRILPDRIHPGPAGHLILAGALLKAWHAPAIVSSVAIDASSGRVIGQENTAVTSLEIASGLSWTQRDNSLPFPIDVSDPAVALAVRCSDLVEALDQQPLRITGLAAPRYLLRIDGQQIGTFHKDELAEGINLALLDTPMKTQALKVYGLTLKHNNLHFGRWKRVQFPLQDESLPHQQKALDALDKLEQDLLDRQREAAQPKARHYELVRE